jgi:hypothetical protein
MKPLLSQETHECENMNSCVLTIKGVLAVAVLGLGLMVFGPTTSEASDTGPKKVEAAKKVKKPRLVTKNENKIADKNKNKDPQKVIRQAR